MSNEGPDWDERRKAERLQAFFDGEKPEAATCDLTIGITDEAYRRREAAKSDEVLAAFDRLMDAEAEEGTLAPIIAIPSKIVTPVLDCELDLERIYPDLILTPYDKARQRVTDAEILKDVSDPGSDDYHEAMAEYAAAKFALKREIERNKDDGWRERRAIDNWRAGEGREDYNASRRKKRSKPNARLKEMTPEARALHKGDKNAEKQWKFSRRKAGRTQAQIDAELPGWWAKRLAKRISD